MSLEQSNGSTASHLASSPTGNFAVPEPIKRPSNAKQGESSGSGTSPTPAAPLLSSQPAASSSSSRPNSTNSAKAATDATESSVAGSLDVSASASVKSEDDAQLTLRALITSKEAGVIIGRGGKNVAELRDATGVKAGVSKVVPGVPDRVLTVSGTLEGVAKAYYLVNKSILENLPMGGTSMNPIPRNNQVSVRLLISHNLMGTIIGRNGIKIKHIQDASSARLVASKEMLPQSTERVVEVQGTIDAIHVAVLEIGKCLIDDRERGVGTILYNPSALTQLSEYSTGRPLSMISNSSRDYPRTGDGNDFLMHPLSPTMSAQSMTGMGAGMMPQPPRNRRYSRMSLSSATRPASIYQELQTSAPPNTVAGDLAQTISSAGGPIRTQQIPIPNDMVGCLIGRGGARIAEIRRLSGARISIARDSHDDSGERMFTIVGTSEATEKALFLLYSQLEAEKERRLSHTGDPQLDI